MDNTPKGYKKTEIGSVPEEWDVMRLGDFSNVISSKRIYFAEYKQQGVPFYRSKEIIERAAGHKVESEIFISEERFKTIKDAFGVPKQGDILVSSVGTLGVTYLVGNERFYFKDGNLIWIKNINSSEPQYILYQTKSKIFKSQIDKSTGGSSQSALTIIKLKDFLFPIPSNREQKAIAFTLSDIDSLITSLEKLIDKKKMIKQGVMQELLTGKRRLAGFSWEWEKEGLGNIFKITSAGNPKYSVSNEGEVFILGMGAVDENGELQYSKKALNCTEILSEGDLIMPTRDIGEGRIIGKVGYIPKSGTFAISNNLYRLELNDKCFSARFFHYLINSPHINTSLKRKVAKSVQLALNKSFVEEEIVSFPKDPREQILIMDSLDDLRAELNKLDSKLSKLKQIKQGAMQQLLTGKIRLINK